MTAQVAQSDSTYTFIERKVRRLTASASEAALSSADIQQAVNTFYNNDFPYAIKMDQQRNVYKFLTIPNVDRYPIDVNNYQGFRAPVYFEGIKGNFFKNRDQLYNLYPRFPGLYQHGVETLNGSITNITQPSNPCSIFSSQHGLQTGAIIQINDVGGMIELNGGVYQITRVNNNVFTLDGIDNTSFGAYTGGGTWISTNTSLNFTLFGNSQSAYPQPSSGILSTQVVIGGIDINGDPIRIIDDGGAIVDGNGIGYNSTVGNLIYVKQNRSGDNVYIDTNNEQQPAIPGLSPLGGYNNNQPYPPSPLTSQYVGTVNYITTQIELALPIPVSPGTQLSIWASPYQVGRPYNLLFWNNEFTIRPVPDKVYLVEVEAYQTPAQFMRITDNPVLKQWAQYIAYGTACEILRERQDNEGLQNLTEGFNRQEALVLERQSIEEIGQPNITMFNTTQNPSGTGIGMGLGF